MFALNHNCVLSFTITKYNFQVDFCFLVSQREDQAIPLHYSLQFQIKMSDAFTRCNALLKLILLILGVASMRKH